MGPGAVELGAMELVAGVLDQIGRANPVTGRPPVPTGTILETLRFFLRERVQWRELRASPQLASLSSRPASLSSENCP